MISGRLFALLFLVGLPAITIITLISLIERGKLDEVGEMISDMKRDVKDAIYMLIFGDEY